MSQELGIDQTVAFNRWFNKLRDHKGQAQIWLCIRRMQSEDFGDIKSVGNRIWELRVDCGPGYRVYFVRRQQTATLLFGGKKSSQKRDIKKATKIARRLEQGGENR